MIKYGDKYKFASERDGARTEPDALRDLIRRREIQFRAMERYISFALFPPRTRVTIW